MFFIFKNIQSKFVNAKKYSDFIGLIVRMTFCIGVSSYFWEFARTNENIFLTIGSYAVAVVFTVLGLAFLPFIEDSMDEFIVHHLKEYKSRIIENISIMIAVVLSLIVFISIMIASIRIAGSLQ